MKLARILMLAAVVSATVAFTQSAAFAQGRTPLFAVLSGGAEVSNLGDANAGDPDGWGSASVILRSNTSICFAILVTGIDTPTAAHIHEAPAGQVAGVTQALTAPTTGNPGRVAGCVVPADAGLVARMRANPAAFYINVHTGAFPNGAVRGQLQ